MNDLPIRLRAQYPQETGSNEPLTIAPAVPLGSIRGRTNQGGRIPTSEGRCLVPYRVNLETTHRLHRQLLDSAEEDPQSYEKISRHALKSLAEHGTKFEGDKAMAFALSALCLDSASMSALQSIAETLHEIVEAALDWVFTSPDRLERYFPDHRRIWPWLRKTCGLASWQGVSRYDAVIRSDGGVRIIELNTGCPAGFLHAEDFSNVTQEAVSALRMKRGEVGSGLGLKRDQFGSIPGRSLIDELLAIERQAGISPATIGLVNDENQLKNELELIAQALRNRGREAAIVNAAEITLQDGRARWRGQTLSLLYNKIRISTANSPKHHWSPGFEDRYAGFLDVIKHDAAVVVNNLAGLSVAEDKGLLEVLRLPEFTAGLPRDQRQFVEEYVLWTARLADRTVDWRGRTVDLLPFVRANRERFVIKPANEGRGFGVVVGKYAGDEEWEAACRIDPNLPCVVQEYAEPARLPVMRGRDQNGLEVADHHLTVGLAMIRRQFRGVLSRISSDPVTNVGRDGIVQAVFLTE